MEANDNDRILLAHGGGGQLTDDLIRRHILPKLENKTFVLTGTMPNLSRDETKEMIRREGGDVSSSVSENTNYVVLGENPGSKYEKAVKAEIKIIREEEFLKILGIE